MQMGVSTVLDNEKKKEVVWIRASAFDGDRCVLWLGKSCCLLKCQKCVEIILANEDRAEIFFHFQGKQGE